MCRHGRGSRRACRRRGRNARRPDGRSLARTNLLRTEVMVVQFLAERHTNRSCDRNDRDERRVETDGQVAQHHRQACNCHRKAESRGEFVTRKVRQFVDVHKHRQHSSGDQGKRPRHQRGLRDAGHAGDPSRPPAITRRRRLYHGHPASLCGCYSATPRALASYSKISTLPGRFALHRGMRRAEVVEVLPYRARPPQRCSRIEPPRVCRELAGG